MTLKQLEYFTAVIDSGSISAAAARLHISQPPLSMQLKELEEELGTVLLERSTRYFRPTDAGLKLYDKARAILDLTEEAKYDLAFSEENIEGKLIIGTISSCGNVLLTPGFTCFTKQYPSIDFELLEGTTFIMLEKMKKREIDLAFLRTPFDDDGLACRYFPEEDMCALGTAESFAAIASIHKDALPDMFHPVSGEQRETEGTLPAPAISLQDLSACPLIVYRRFEELIRRTFRAHGLPINIRCLNDDARTSLMWACAGVGICLIPESIARQFLREGIVMRRIDCEDFKTHVAIAFRQGQYLSPAARKFLEVFEKETTEPG